MQCPIGAIYRPFSQLTATRLADKVVIRLRSTLSLFLGASVVILFGDGFSTSEGRRIAVLEESHDLLLASREDNHARRCAFKTREQMVSLYSAYGGADFNCGYIKFPFKTTISHVG